MADTQIDELRLDISIEDKTSGESSSKKVRDLATAISRLNNAVKNFDAAKMAQTFNALTASIKPLARELKSASKGLENLASVAKTSGLNKLTKNISPLLKKEKVSTSEGKYNRARLEQGKFFPSKDLTGAKKNLKDFAKNTDKATKAHNKLLKSFGRIALYRAIRAVLKQITQAFSESIRELSSRNSELNSSMTQITSSLQQVKASIGVALYQPLIALTPVITAISNAFVQFSNGLSYVFAKLSGAKTFFKVNTEYIKEYQSALNGVLLSFDTFETLGNQGTDFSKVFEEVETDSTSLGAELGNIKVLLETIGVILAGFATIKIIGWITGGGPKELVKSLTNMKTKINDISKAGMIASSAFAFVATLINLIDVIKNWNSQSLVTKITAITAAALGLFAVFASIMALIPGFGAANVFKALAVGATAGATILGVVSAMKFADGGMFDGAGTMYALAGEAGPEIVAQGSAGTGVLNVDQFADAMVSALVRYGAARDNGNGQVIEIDGNKLGTLIASNSGFRNEMNRRNAGLNLR